MSFLDSIVECNRHDLSKYRPFVVDQAVMGWVRHDLAQRLTAFADLFVVTDANVAIHPSLNSEALRSQAFDRFSRQVVRDWGVPALKGELYPVARRWGQQPLMKMDRSMVALFGVPSHGVHVNGVVQKRNGLHLWIGTRALNKSVAPGKLDNMVAGGQPHDLSIMDNLVKEAHEEAGIPEALARTARSVGMISYVREDTWGLRPDVMFCFDLDVPETFVPQNTDGEISGFALMPVAHVAQRVRDTKDFKLNVNLVIIDLLIRHGLLTPDGEPDYVDIAQGLRRGFNHILDVK